MSQKSSRKQRKTLDQVLPILQKVVTCGDCNADVSTWIDDHGIGHVQVAHDDTCPTFRAMQNGGVL